jgi:hypothetical protein
MSTQRAIKLKLNAQRRRALAPDYDPVRRQFELELANEMDAESEALLTPPEPLKRGLGAEIVPRMEDGLPGLGLTLTEPDLLNAETSQQRANLLERANVLELGIEAAQEAKASNALEKMMCHQLAAAHKRAMELVTASKKSTCPEIAVKQARAAARMMDAFSRSVSTLQRLQMGASQVVQIQHVQVVGHAVVNQAGGLNENLQNPHRQNRGGRPPTTGDRTKASLAQRQADKELISAFDTLKHIT